MKPFALGCSVVVVGLASACQGAAPETARERSDGTQDVARVESTRLTSRKVGSHEITLARTFKAGASAVFASLTQPSHIRQWMRAAGMELVVCDVDLRVGGSFRYVFQRPSGARIAVMGAITVVEIPRHWSYTETYNFSPLTVAVDTSLADGGGMTNFTQRLRYASQAERDADYDGVATSAAEAFDRLDRYLLSRQQ